MKTKHFFIRASGLDSCGVLFRKTHSATGLSVRRGGGGGLMPIYFSGGYSHGYSIVTYTLLAWAWIAAVVVALRLRRLYVALQDASLKERRSGNFAIAMGTLFVCILLVTPFSAIVLSPGQPDRSGLDVETAQVCEFKKINCDLQTKQTRICIKQYIECLDLARAKKI